MSNIAASFSICYDRSAPLRPEWLEANVEAFKDWLALFKILHGYPMDLEDEIRHFLHESSTNCADHNTTNCLLWNGCKGYKEMSRHELFTEFLYLNENTDPSKFKDLLDNIAGVKEY